MSTNEVVVRPVETGDVQELQENCFLMNTLEELRDRVDGNLRMHEEGEGMQLVAEVDGAVIGTATLRRNPHPLFAHRAELDSIVVHGDYQRRGIARQMVQASREYARSLGIEILETSCRGGTAAETAYARMGFVEYGRLPGGIVEPWDDRQNYDQVFFYLTVV
jgi:GNAT superfamily N-acetyltransferase